MFSAGGVIALQLMSVHVEQCSWLAGGFGCQPYQLAMRGRGVTGLAPHACMCSHLSKFEDAISMFAAQVCIARHRTFAVMILPPNAPADPQAMQHEPGTNIVANGALATLSGAPSTGGDCGTGLCHIRRKSMHGINNFVNVTAVSAQLSRSVCALGAVLTRCLMLHAVDIKA